MENQHSKIDEIFRQRLHDAEAPPPPFVWPAVEKALRKKRRQVLFFWVFGCTALLGSSALIWQLGFAKQNTIADNAKTVTELPVQNALSPDHKTSDKLTLSDNNPAPDELKNEASNVRQEGNKQEVSTGKLDSRAIPDNQTKNYLKRESFKKGNQNANQEEAPQVIAGSEANMDPQALTHTGIADADLFLKINAPGSISAFSKEAPIGITKPYKPFSRRKKTQPKVCYDFASHPRAWLLDVYAGPSLAQRSLTSRLDDEPYLNQRLTTESRSSAISAGIRASLLFNRNLLVRTGLHFDQLTEKFEFIDPTSIIYLLKYTPGNPVPDTLGVQYGENYLKTYNRYAMLDIPLMVGVEMRRGRSGLSMNAGLSANIMFRKSGVIMDPNTHEPARIGAVPQDPKAPGPKTSLSQDVFHTNLGLSATASVQWYWHVRPSFRLFVEPSFRQMLRPITLPSHPVDQRYSILSLRLGASKIF